MDTLEAADELAVQALDTRRVSALLATLLDGELPAYELAALQELKQTLDVYQEVPQLLDASLEQLAEPAIRGLKAALEHASSAEARSLRLSQYLYHLMKVRGHKAVVRFFPHQVTDLDWLLSLFRDQAGFIDRIDAWELRYILLLWLSLVCLLPFDLARWDRASSAIRTSHTLLELGTRYLSSPGKERDAAAILLGRLLARKDASQTELPAFLARCEREFAATEPDAFILVGLLQTLCELVKVATRQSIVMHTSALYALLGLCDPSSTGARNPLIRRLRAKLAGRLALLFLPTRRASVKPRAHSLAIAEVAASPPIEKNSNDTVVVTDFYVPDQVETLAQDLLEATEDVDGAVRYSAAKHLARIVAALPSSMSEQILELLISRFSEGVIKGKDGHEDLTNVSDAAWQGICLTLAECARKAAIPASMLAAVMPWLIKAVTLDRRKGTRIVGANVRDAAAYVCWAFARAYSPKELQPYIDELSRSLVVVACYDREIHVRRAASAALQELVGRTAHVPHGIDLLHAVDFYRCGIRRLAFLESAPSAASYEPYRRPLFDHLLHVVLCHYDSGVRILGAQSLSLMVRDNEDFARDAAAHLLGEMSHSDRARLHGALVGLAAVVRPSDATTVSAVLTSLGSLPPSVMKGFASDTIVEAACALLEKSIRARPQAMAMDFDATPLLTAAAGKTSINCHKAAASALAALSADSHVSKHVKRLVAALSSYSPFGQHFAAMALGEIDYNGPTHASMEVVSKALLAFVDIKAPRHASSIEGRCNGLRALTKMSCSTNDAPLPIELIAFIREGFDDYTSDQRGDVGSLVRMASMSCLADLHCRDLLDRDTLQASLCAVLRMFLERMDNVRDCAIRQLQRLSERSADLSGSLFDLAQSLGSVQDKTMDAILPNALHYFCQSVTEHKLSMLQGAAYGISWPDEIMQPQPAARIFVDWFVGQESSEQIDFLDQTLTLIERDRLFNRRFIPYTRMVSCLLRDPSFSSLPADVKARFATVVASHLRGVETAKSKQRVSVLADLFLASLKHRELQAMVLPFSEVFLSHAPVEIRERVGVALSGLEVADPQAIMQGSE